MWGFPKIVGFPPKSSILIRFSIIFTIHFGVFHYFWKHPCSSHDPDSHGRSHIFFGGAVAAADPMVVASTRSSLEISLWSTSAWSMRNFTVL